MGYIMSNDKINEKLLQFNEFFSIKHTFNINVKLLNNDEIISHKNFIENIPTAFKLANDMAVLDEAALAPLGAISGIAGQLAQFLHHQNKKIDLLINHILSEQDNATLRHKGITFGGGGIEFCYPSPFTLNDLLEIKIFLSDQNCAVFCYAAVIEIKKNDDVYNHKVVFHHIREEDREKLVRSSLHLQSKQLQQLAKERNQELSDPTSN